MNLDVVIKTLDLKSHKFSVKSNITVEQLKSLIAEKVKIHPKKQRFLFKGKELPNDKTLDEYDLSERSIFLVDKQPLRGSTATFCDSQSSENISDVAASIQFRTVAIENNKDAGPSTTVGAELKLEPAMTPPAMCSFDMFRQQTKKHEIGPHAQSLYLNKEYVTQRENFPSEAAFASEALQQPKEDNNQPTASTAAPQASTTNMATTASLVDENPLTSPSFKKSLPEIRSSASSTFHEVVQNVSVINHFETPSTSSLASNGPPTLQIRIPISELFTTEDLNGVLTRTIEVVQSFSPQSNATSQAAGQIALAAVDGGEPGSQPKVERDDLESEVHTDVEPEAERPLADFSRPRSSVRNSSFSKFFRMFKRRN